MYGQEQKKNPVKHPVTYNRLYKSYLRNDHHQKQRGGNYPVWNKRNHETGDVTGLIVTPQQGAERAQGPFRSPSARPACHADQDRARLSSPPGALSCTSEGHPHGQEPCSVKQ